MLDIRVRVLEMYGRVAVSCGEGESEDQGGSEGQGQGAGRAPSLRCKQARLRRGFPPVLPRRGLDARVDQRQRVLVAVVHALRTRHDGPMRRAVSGGGDVNVEGRTRRRDSLRAQ